MPSKVKSRIHAASLQRSASAKDDSVKHPRRLTVRVRLAFTYAAMVLVTGIVMMVIVSVFVGILPRYNFARDPQGIDPEDPVSIDPLPGIVPLNPQVQGGNPLIPINISSQGDMLQLLLVVSGIALVLLAVAGAVVGWFVAGRMLRPLQEVNAAASRAASGHFDHRIGTTGPRDEISDLAATFDDMLEEIERSVDAHRRFAANASHELRTPLATTRTMLDVALLSRQCADTDLLTRLRDTNERSIATVESLLDLAEIEAVNALFQLVDLQEVAEQVVAETADEARNAGVELHADLGAASTDGNPVLLRQLMMNLVQNAIRHNHPKGSIWLRLDSQPDTAVLSVANTGRIIDPGALVRLRDPFVRGQGRINNSETRGRGLGLSIVSAITTRHGAALSATARDEGGLLVKVCFPAKRHPG